MVLNSTLLSAMSEDRKALTTGQLFTRFRSKRSPVRHPHPRWNDQPQYNKTLLIVTCLAYITSSQYVSRYPKLIAFNIPTFHTNITVGLARDRLLLLPGQLSPLRTSTADSPGIGTRQRGAGRAMTVTKPTLFYAVTEEWPILDKATLTSGSWTQFKGEFLHHSQQKWTTPLPFSFLISERYEWFPWNSAGSNIRSHLYRRLTKVKCLP